MTDLAREVAEQAPMVQALADEIGKVVVGQRYLVDRLILALIADGHILVEGIPGLAKTTAVRAVAEAVQADFARIQFTPDLLPADLIGTEIFRPHSGDFAIRKGPVFTQLLLADEINRAPAKVQSALLEAMQERQVTIGEHTYVLPDPFIVLATQNPIEQEGTYTLPEAQVDRFMMKLRLGYPDRAEEKEVMRRMSRRLRPHVSPVLTAADIVRARQVADGIYLDAKVEDYIVEVVFATRQPQAHKLAELAPLIGTGASPRATIALAQAAKVHAFMGKRAYVTPQDVKQVAPDVLRHRILLSYEAEAREMDSDRIIATLLNTIDVP